MTDTTLVLEPRTVEALQDLIGVNLDSAESLDEAAGAVPDGSLRRLFAEMSVERRKFADRLAGCVARQGDAPLREGSFRATMRRWWLLFRGVIEGGDPYSILAETERGEDRIKSRYEEVLMEIAGGAADDVLRSQYSVVKQRHNLIRKMRDERRTGA